jgi:hypothetical protein
MNLATFGRGLLHEGLAAGLVFADALSILKALEILGATPRSHRFYAGQGVGRRLAGLRVYVHPLGDFSASNQPGSAGSHREISVGEASAPVMVFGHRRSMFAPHRSDRWPTCRPRHRLSMPSVRRLSRRWRYGAVHQRVLSE